MALYHHSHPRPPSPMNPRLFQLAKACVHKVIPIIFFHVVLVFSTLIITFSAGLKRPLPTKVTAGFTAALGVLALLYVMGLVLVFLKKPNPEEPAIAEQAIEHKFYSPQHSPTRSFQTSGSRQPGIQKSDDSVNSHELRVSHPGPDEMSPPFDFGNGSVPSAEQGLRGERRRSPRAGGGQGFGRQNVYETPTPLRYSNTNGMMNQNGINGSGINGNDANGDDIDLNGVNGNHRHPSTESIDRHQFEGDDPWPIEPPVHPSRVQSAQPRQQQQQQQRRQARQSQQNGIRPNGNLDALESSPPDRTRQDIHVNFVTITIANDDRLDELLSKDPPYCVATPLDDPSREAVEAVIRRAGGGYNNNNMPEPKDEPCKKPSTWWTSRTLRKIDEFDDEEKSLFPFEYLPPSPPVSNISDRDSDSDSHKQKRGNGTVEKQVRFESSAKQTSRDADLLPPTPEESEDGEEEEEEEEEEEKM